jgi:phage terminase large subunit-like protein
VSHAGVFGALEDEMCTFGSPGFAGSPDRLDALVWAIGELLLNNAWPRLRSL